VSGARAGGEEEQEALSARGGDTEASAAEAHEMADSGGLMN